jgi:hypothetical protein
VQPGVPATDSLPLLQKRSGVLRPSPAHVR